MRGGEGGKGGWEAGRLRGSLLVSALAGGGPGLGGGMAGIRSGWGQGRATRVTKVMFRDRSGSKSGSTR